MHTACKTPEIHFQGFYKINSSYILKIRTYEYTKHQRHPQALIPILFEIGVECLVEFYLPSSQK